MVSPSAAVADLGHHRTDLALLPSPAAEPDRLDDFRAIVAALTGLDAASPRTADIVSAAAAGVMTAMLMNGSSAHGAVALRLPEPTAPYPGEAPRPGKATHRNERPDRAHLTLARSPTLPVKGQLCAVFAADIVGFTRPDRDDDIRSYLHEQLYDYLRRAFDGAGVPWDECFLEDRGDGALVVIPPEIAVKGLIDPLPEKLRALIRRHNHVSVDAAKMQLRAAVTIGPLEHDGYGFVGSDVNLAFRMLASRPLKRMLAESGAEFGLVVSDYVYRDLVCRYPSRVRPGEFQPVKFQSKNTRARAWTYLPGTLPSRSVADGVVSD
jgi:class 3 adenylate cyclase